jgi:hypothetical protein
LMTRTPNEIGNEYERLATGLLSGIRVKASGAGRFLKSDVGDLGRRIWSVKGTDKDRITITESMLTDARRAAHGTQGRGDGSRWGMILGIGGKCYALIELEDHVEQATAPAEERRLPQTRGEARRQALRRT